MSPTFPLATFRRAWLACAWCGGWRLHLRRWWGWHCPDCRRRLEADGTPFPRQETP